jgi:hypothetical protein
MRNRKGYVKRFTASSEVDTLWVLFVNGSLMRMGPIQERYRVDLPHLTAQDGSSAATWLSLTTHHASKV